MLKNAAGRSLMKQMVDYAKRPGMHGEMQTIVSNADIYPRENGT